MPVKFGVDNPMLMAWHLLHQTHNSISKCEDEAFSKHGITTEQYSVLMAIKHIQPPVTPTQVGRWLDRNTNTISLIVERMVKAGLVRRIRDLRDRRSVRLVLTDDGKEIFDRATVTGLALVQEILSVLSEEQMRTLTTLLQMVREKAVDYHNPGETLEEVKKNDSKNMARFIKRMSKYLSNSDFVKKKQGKQTSV